MSFTFVSVHFQFFHQLCNKSFFSCPNQSSCWILGAAAEPRISAVRSAPQDPLRRLHRMRGNCRDHSGSFALILPTLPAKAASCHRSSKPDRTGTEPTGAMLRRVSASKTEPAPISKDVDTGTDSERGRVRIEICPCGPGQSANTAHDETDTSGSKHGVPAGITQVGEGEA